MPRKYDDRREEIIAAFIESGRNVAETARAMGIPKGGTLYGLLYRWNVMQRPVRKPKAKRKEQKQPKTATDDKLILRGSLIRQRGEELEKVRSRAHELLQNSPALKSTILRNQLEKEFPGIKLPKSTLSTWCHRSVAAGNELPVRVQLTVGYRSITIEDTDNKIKSKLLVEFLVCCNMDLAIALRDTLSRDMRLDR